MIFISIHRRLIIAIASMAILTSHARAQIIYADTLIGSGTVKNTQPATNTGGAVWTANDYGPQKSGTGLFTLTGISDSAYLPLTVDGTGTYTLTVTGYVPASSNEGISFGFINGTQTPTSGLSSSSAVAFVSINGGGPGTAGATDIYGGATGGSTSSTYDAAHTFSISLDSSTGSLTFSQDGTVYETAANALTSLQMAGITGIGFGFGYTNSATANFSNFSLTEVSATPEPSTYALLLVSLALLVFMGRRRRLLS